MNSNVVKLYSKGGKPSVIEILINHTGDHATGISEVFRYYPHIIEEELLNAVASASDMINAFNEEHKRKNET